MTILVDCTTRILSVEGDRFRCAIGRGGAIPSSHKREGDGCTPIGSWPLRGALIRPNRGYPPPLFMSWRWSRDSDGWCDDPADEHYNRPVRLPHSGSAEFLRRSDDKYDVVIVLGYNDRPVVRDRGSAIFIHLEEDGATAGCVAISPAAMRAVLASTATTMSIVASHLP